MLDYFHHFALVIWAFFTWLCFRDQAQISNYKPCSTESIKFNFSVTSKQHLWSWSCVHQQVKQTNYEAHSVGSNVLWAIWTEVFMIFDFYLMTDTHSHFLHCCMFLTTKKLKKKVWNMSLQLKSLFGGHTWLYALQYTVQIHFIFHYIRGSKLWHVCWLADADKTPLITYIPCGFKPKKMLVMFWYTPTTALLTYRYYKIQPSSTCKFWRHEG